MTDAGIERLCVIGECKLIEYLDLRRTKVTSEGVIMALQNLSSLTVLEHDTVTEALHEIHKLGALENKLKDLSKFSLSNISICASDIPWWNWETFLKSTVFLCPSITQVNFRGDYDSFDDRFNVVYSFLIMLWATLLVESWKRKESYIANKWLMRDYQEHAELRKEYKYKLDVDSETRSEWRINMTNRFLRLMLVGIPISFIFIALVVAAQVGMRYWYLSIITDPTEEPSFIYRVTPFLCYAFLLIIFGQI